MTTVDDARAALLAYIDEHPEVYETPADMVAIFEAAIRAEYDYQIPYKTGYGDGRADGQRRLADAEAKLAALREALTITRQAYERRRDMTSDELP